MLLQQSVRCRSITRSELHHLSNGVVHGWQTSHGKLRLPPMSSTWSSSWIASQPNRQSGAKLDAWPPTRSKCRFRLHTDCNAAAECATTPWSYGVMATRHTSRRLLAALPASPLINKHFSIPPSHVSFSPQLCCPAPLSPIRALSPSLFFPRRQQLPTRWGGRMVREKARAGRAVAEAVVHFA